MATQDRSPSDDVGALVIGAADGDRSAWEQLVTGFSGLVASITEAHRLNDVESAQVRAAVWHRLGRSLGKIRQPDRVGTWLGLQPTMLRGHWTAAQVRAGQSMWT